MNPSEQLSHMEGRLAEIETLEQTLDQVERELTVYRETLVKKLTFLQQSVSSRPASVPPATREAPARTVAPAEPQPVKRQATPGLPPGPGEARPVQRPATPVTPAKPVEARPAQPTTPPRPAAASDSRTQQRPPAAGDSRTQQRPAATGDSRTQQRPAVPAATPRAGDSRTLRKEAPPPAAANADTDEAGAERRTSPQQGNPIPLLITSAAIVGEPAQGWVVDRSAGGLRILTDQSYAAGSILSVRPAKAHASFPWIKVKVRTCRPERSSWSLGCQFVEKPSWGELQMFG